jgi:hypothetical protein
VRFANIYRQEIGVVFVIVKEQRDVANLATEGRSSETAENENQRLAGYAFANVKIICSIQRDELRVRSVVADFQISATHVGEGVADHIQRVLGTSSHFAEEDTDADQEDAEADADPHKDFLLPRQTRTP